MSEEKFWRCSPRKLWALTKVHVKIQNPDGEGSGSDTGVRKVYIDQVLF
jgi:hypothetical protein